MLLDSTALLNRKHLMRGDGAWLMAYPEPASTAPLAADSVILYSAATPHHQPNQPNQPDQPDQPDQSSLTSPPQQPLVVDAGGISSGAEPGALAPCGSGVAVLTYGNGVPKALEARGASLGLGLRLGLGLGLGLG